MSSTPLSAIRNDCGPVSHPDWRLHMNEVTWHWLIREHLVGSGFPWEHRQAPGNGPTERTCNHLPVEISGNVGNGIILLEKHATGSDWTLLRAWSWVVS